MDIRNLGQSMMTRLRQLPAQATHLAENLPETLKDLPAKAQDVVAHLPEHLEEGAKSVLANETVAQGWRTVGKGVGELVGFQPGDQVSLTNPATPVVKPPVSGGNAVLNPAAEIPAGTVAAPKPSVGSAIPNAATRAAKPRPVVAPQPGAVSVIKEPGFVSGPTVAEPASTVGKTLKQARTTKEAGRVASGVRNLVKPSAPAVSAPVAAAPVVAAPAAPAVAAPVAVPLKRAADVLKNGAKVPVKVQDLSTLKEYASASKHIAERAALLKEVGQPEAAQKLTELSARLSRAGELAKQGNTPAASRMLHAKFKVGLRNPSVQDAIRLANRADDLKAAFGTPTVSEPFAAASQKMLSRAKQLADMGHAGEARTLTNFAKKLQTAGESYAAGDKSAAMKLFRSGLTEKTQQALKVSDKADEVFAAFGKGKGATTTATSAKATVEALKAEVTQVAQEGTKVVTRAAKAAKGGAQAIEAGGAAVASEAASATQQVTTSARSATSAARVAKGASGTKAAASAATAGEAAQAATQTVTRGAKAAKGAQAVQAAGSAAKEVVKDAAQVAGTAAKEVAKDAAQVAGTAAKEVAKDAVSAAGSGAAGTAKGMFGKVVDGAKNLFGKASERVKGLFGKIKTGAGNSAGWQTIKQGFKEMLPGLKKAAVSSAIFSAVFSTAENLFKMFKGERAPGRALGGVLGDTLGGTVGGVISSLASGAAIAGLGALGVVGWPVTLAAGAVGILGFMAFDRFFRKSWVYDQITHLFT